MGDLKSKRIKKDDVKEFSLTNFELNYLKSLAVNRNEAYNSYQRAIQVFLAYLAGSKWGYNAEEQLEFEMDNEKELVRVKVL